MLETTERVTPGPARATAQARPRPSSGGRGRGPFGPLLLAPAFMLVLVVTFYPAFYAIGVSLFDTTYLTPDRFAGLKHYLGFLADPAGRNNILRSVIYVAGSLLLALPLGMVLAILLNRPIRLRTFFRAAILVPWLISQIATALLWGWLVNPQFGPVPYLLRQIAWTAPDFLGTPPMAMATLIGANVWRSFPYPMLLFLAALQAVPKELLDAALVDGAVGLARFRHVVLPLIRNAVLVAFILLTLHYFNMVTLPLILTGGGPVGATDVMTLRLFREAFSFHHVGLASAIAVIVFLFNVLFSLTYLKLLRGESLS